MASKFEVGVRWCDNKEVQGWCVDATASKFEVGALVRWRAGLRLVCVWCDGKQVRGWCVGVMASKFEVGVLVISVGVIASKFEVGVCLL